MCHSTRNIIIIVIKLRSLDLVHAHGQTLISLCSSLHEKRILLKVPENRRAPQRRCVQGSGQAHRSVRRPEETGLKNESQGVPSTAIRDISTLKHPQRPNGAFLLDIPRNNHITEDIQQLMVKAVSWKTPVAVNPLKRYLRQLSQNMVYCPSHRALLWDLKPRSPW